MKRIAVYISGKSNRLHKYLRSKDESNHGIAYVFSDEPIDGDLENELSIRGIDYTAIDYKNIGITKEEKRSAFSNCLLSELNERGVDYCLSFGEHILVGDILLEYKNRIINFHPAILPMYKGTMAIDQAVEDDKAMLVGNTAHFVDEGVDTGLIIMQSVIPIKAFYDADNDYNVILDLQIDMMDKIIFLLNNDRIRIVDNRVVIIGADYSVSHIYPKL